MEIINNEISWKEYSFDELTISVLYEILRLRHEVFIVEQADIYLDLDNKDQEAKHILGYMNDEVVAYCRVFAGGNYYIKEATIGRVLLPKKYRGMGVGRMLIQKALESLSAEKVIKISAQLYLQGFYESFGFKAEGVSYLDGTVEHVDMVFCEKS